jgi:hypothetical protein
MEVSEESISCFWARPQGGGSFYYANQQSGDEGPRYQFHPYRLGTIRVSAVGSDKGVNCFNYRINFVIAESFIGAASVGVIILPQADIFSCLFE